MAWRRRPTRRLAVWVTGVLALAAVGPCRFGYDRVCTTCGRMEVVTQRQLPFVPVTYWRTAAVRDTPLSRAAAEAGLDGPHAHAWLFAAGSGNGVMCAIGEGRHLHGVVDGPTVASFLRGAAAATDGPAEGGRWPRRALDPATVRPVRFALTAAGFPDGGFPDPAGAARWWAAHKGDVNTYFAMATAPATPATAAAPAAVAE